MSKFMPTSPSNGKTQQRTVENRTFSDLTRRKLEQDEYSLSELNYLNEIHTFNFEIYVHYKVPLDWKPRQQTI